MKALLIALMITTAAPIAMAAERSLDRQNSTYDSSMKLAHGKFEAADDKHSTAGHFAITERAGKLTLKFDKHFRTSEGPDLRVVLRDSSGKMPMMIVRELKSFTGQQSYRLNISAADLANYDEVVIYCAKFHVDFGIAAF